MTVLGVEPEGEKGRPGGAEIGRLVAIGGGHGLATTLRAALLVARDVTAVVSVADDGGSSGRLRETLGVAPPGDLRRCLSALADPGSALGRALEHRFTGGDLAGHALGNVLLVGLAESGGDLVTSCQEVGGLIGARGRVLPAATDPIVLGATTARATVEGQTAVQNAAGVRSLSMQPADPEVPEAVLDAIEAADQVVLGPGSLYTSVLAAAAVPGVRKALGASAAQKAYVCNLGPQVPESAGYDAADHLRALQRHDIPVDVMICNTGSLGGCPDPADVAPVGVVDMVVAGPSGLAHDPLLLAEALLTCHRTGATRGDLFG